jgi:hypothetical protein
VPVHTYLLAQQGAMILELVQLEQLARDRVYEFAFIGASLKLRGADAADRDCTALLRVNQHVARRRGPRRGIGIRHAQPAGNYSFQGRSMGLEWFVSRLTGGLSFSFSESP